MEIPKIKVENGVAPPRAARLEVQRELFLCRLWWQELGGKFLPEEHLRA